MIILSTTKSKHIVILANYCKLAIGGILVGDEKLPLKILINFKNIQNIESKALCKVTDETNCSLAGSGENT